MFYVLTLEVQVTPVPEFVYELSMNKIMDDVCCLR